MAPGGEDAPEWHSGRSASPRWWACTKVRAENRTLARCASRFSVAKCRHASQDKGDRVDYEPQAPGGVKDRMGATTGEAGVRFGYDRVDP
jgi:hypothetical protein